MFSLFVSLFSFQQLHSCMKFGRTRDDICTAKYIYISNSVKDLGEKWLTALCRITPSMSDLCFSRMQVLFHLSL